MSVVLDALICIAGWTHVLLAPFHKVEESFSLHGVHDVLLHGLTPSALTKYDHFTFPGAVPRTFIGNVILAWISIPVISGATALDFVRTKFDLQIILRLVLASLNAISLCMIRRAVQRRFGRLTSFFFALFTISQFHLPFWMGRTVPNSYALILANISTALLLRGSSTKTAISLLTVAAVVFRAEIALLLGPICLQLLATSTIGFKSLLTLGLTASLLSIAATVLIDSYFWDQSLLWPEFSAIYFNVFQGKSAEWGVSPPLTYFTSFLPKLLLSALPLSLLGFVGDHRVTKLLAPCWAFIGLISFLGHKEWRFIIYTVPAFNVGAARACKAMVSWPKGLWIKRLLYTATFAAILANLAFTSLTTYVSAMNYPGGKAMQSLHSIYPPSTPVHVHICNLAAQTGASLFLQLNAPPFWPSPPHDLAHPWVYNKTEGLQLQDLLSPRAPFTHLILEDEPEAQLEGWKVVYRVPAFDGVSVDMASIKSLLRPQGNIAALPRRVVHTLLNVVKIKQTTKIWILERTQ